MTATKRCTKCGVDKPATPEYFYRNKREKDGLNVMCKKCMQEYQANYYGRGRRKEPETPGKLPLPGESKKRVLSKYQVGQTLTIRHRGQKEGSKECEFKNTKIKILGFYPNLVLCLKDNCKECYNYQEMDQMLAKGDK